MAASVAGVLILVIGGVAAAVGGVGTAEPVPGLAAMSAVNDFVVDVSCGPDGQCSAVGRYTDVNAVNQGFVVDTTDGAWGDARPVPGLDELDVGNDVELSQVSCGPGGHCMAVGLYSDSGIQGFYTERTSTGWSDAEAIPGLGLLSIGNVLRVVVSCPSVDVCAIGGAYTDVSGNSQGFLAEKRGGSWTPAAAVPGLATSGPLNTGPSGVTAISCATAESCSAVGYYSDANGSQGFVVDRSAAGWGSAIAVPGLAAPGLSHGLTRVEAVSCAAVDDCSATGVYVDSTNGTQGFVVDRSAAGWGSAMAVPGLATIDTNSQSFPFHIDCGAAGSCAVGGFFFGSNGIEGFLADRSGGIWSTAIEIPGFSSRPPGTIFINGVACSDSSTCAAVGFLDELQGQSAFLNQRTGGTWGTAVSIPGLAALSQGNGESARSVACARNGNCVIGGSYTDASQIESGFLTQFLPLPSTTSTTPEPSTTAQAATTPAGPVEPRFAG